MNGTTVKKPAFNAAVDDVLKEALRISDERGNEYADSWALENQETRFLDMIIRAINYANSDGYKYADLTREEKRLIMVACLCDVKLSRMLGGYKADTLNDLINYTAALRKWLGEYSEGTAA